MKKHYFFNDKEITEGDFGKFYLEINGEKIEMASPLSARDLELLEKIGFAKVTELSDDTDIPENPLEFINKLCKRLEVEEGVLKRMYKFSKNAFISLLSKEISICLDNKYPGHIKSSANVYMINSWDKTVVSVTNSINNKLDDNFVKTYALFRTTYDAYFAINIIEKIVKLWDGEKEKCKCENKECCQ